MWQFVQEITLALAAFVLGLGLGEPLPETTTPPAEAPSEVASTTRAEHTVTHVVDGDTIKLDTGQFVRLYGIDTPEREECYSAESTAFVREWLSGEIVWLETDVRDRDTHGRLLRYVFVAQEPDGRAAAEPILVNLVLIEEGYARSLPIGPDRRYRDAFYQAQLAAQDAELGRWSACE